MGEFEALDHVPTEATYAIRIHSRPNDRYIPFNSELYTIDRYFFADRTPEYGEGILFDEDLATKVLTNFRERGLGKETLLIHCIQGKNRSPAVGIALNEIFELGHSTDKLKEQYPEANWHVYNTMIKVAKYLPTQNPTSSIDQPKNQAL